MMRHTPLDWSGFILAKPRNDHESCRNRLSDSHSKSDRYPRMDLVNISYMWKYVNVINTYMYILQFLVWEQQATQKTHFGDQPAGHHKQIPKSANTNWTKAPCKVHQIVVCCFSAFSALPMLPDRNKTRNWNLIWKLHCKALLLFNWVCGVPWHRAFCRGSLSKSMGSLQPLQWSHHKLQCNPWPCLSRAPGEGASKGSG